MDTMSLREEDTSYLMIDDFNNGHSSPQMSSSSKRNLSPSHDDRRDSRNGNSDTYDRNDSGSSRNDRSHRTRSRSRSHDERRSRNHRSRSPRRDRSRDRHGGSSYRRSDNSGRSGGGAASRYRWEKTVYVSNIPYDVRWTELKDLFRAKVQVEPLYCELFEKDGKSLGVGAIEFKTVSDAEKAVEVMHQYELGGRRISVRIDGEGYKYRQAKEMAEGHSGSSSSSSNKNSSNSSVDPNSTAAALLASTLAPNLLSLLGLGNPLLGASTTAPILPTSILPTSPGSPSSSGNLLNQNAVLNQIANQLKVEGPVTNRLFVASLDYKVDEQKIKEVFGLAGNVTNVSLFKDRDNKSRGMAVVEYESAYEALNAVSMFNKQTLMDRQMTVRFDTKPPTKEEEYNREKSLMSSSSQAKLPSGLKSIGNSLGLNLLGSSGSAAPAPVANPLSLSALTALTGLGATSASDLSLGLGSSGLGLLGNFSNNSASQSNGRGSYSQSNNGSSSNGNGITKIFVKNIPFSWDERKLKEKFRQAGSIEFADIKVKDGKSRGCGLIRFSTSEQAQKAVELFNGSRFEGRTLDVKLDLY